MDSMTSQVIEEPPFSPQRMPTTHRKPPGAAVSSAHTSPSGFGPQLRTWRQFRRLSQLELSLRADISQRHLSWLETGRSRPSRQMVVQLCETLDMPLRERNRLLHAAGFAALYRTGDLDDERMQAIRHGLRRMLDQQMPYPSLVVDREWNLLMMNPCAEALLGMLADESWWSEHGDGRRNLALLTLHPHGLKPLIENWHEVALSFAHRLRRDLEATRDPDLRAALEPLLAMAGEPAGRDEPDMDLLPILTLDLRLGDRLLRLFSIISTLGTAQDVTAEELRIESFFPADPDSESLLRGLGSPTGAADPF